MQRPTTGVEPALAAATRSAPKEDGSQHEAPATLVIIGGSDSDLARRAEELGLSALLATGPTLDVAISLALRRLQELHKLKRLQERAPIVERAKGVLMERHGMTEAEAFALLRTHARNGNYKLLDVANAVTGSHLLLRH
jgi:AmiR/NasT family two-component response regulator